jgi:proteasome component ECM29
VQNLVSTFTEGRKIASQSVAGNTELFSSNALGNTPDGSNLTTYQSILSLAADMNQPDLVYKFMSLASHHAVWNSRRGASMGFSTIAARAEKELEPYLPSIIPKLYRYQFDPHPKTAMGMKSIWKSLVKNQNIVNDLFREIMSELLKSMGDKQWRTRESRYESFYLVVLLLPICCRVGKWNNWSRF